MKIDFLYVPTWFSLIRIWMVLLIFSQPIGFLCRGRNHERRGPRWCQVEGGSSCSRRHDSAHSRSSRRHSQTSEDRAARQTCSTVVPATRHACAPLPGWPIQWISWRLCNYPFYFLLWLINVFLISLSLLPGFQNFIFDLSNFLSFILITLWFRVS